MKRILFFIFILININFIFSDIYRHNTGGLDKTQSDKDFIYFNVSEGVIDENRSLVRTGTKYMPKPNLGKSEEQLSIIFNTAFPNKHYEFQNSINFKTNWLNSTKCILTFNNNGNEKYFTANFNITGDERTQGGINRAYINYLKKNYNNLLESVNINNDDKKNFTGKQILESSLWMKVNISYEIEETGFFTDDTGSTNILIDDDGISLYEIKEKIRNEVKSGWEEITITDVEINDFKCDFYGGNSLNKNSEAKQEINFSNENDFFDGKNNKIFNLFTKEKDKISLTKKFILNDTNEKENKKISIEYNDEKVYYDDKELNLETLNENYSLEKIALILHNFKNLKNKEIAESFLNETIENLNFFLPKKNISFGETQKEITISLNQSLDFENKILWLYFPKQNFNNIKDNIFIENETGLLIKDKDPLIGWSLKKNSKPKIKIDNNKSDNFIIIIEDKKDNEIITSKNLVFNYRTENCLDNEKFLFNAKKTGSLFNITKDDYKICVSHFNKDINKKLKDDISLIPNLNISKIIKDKKVFSDIPSDLYQDVLIGEIPENSLYREFYSCLGSHNETHFGDCDYNLKKRIWVYVGDKPVKVLEIQYPYLKYTNSNTTFNVKVFDTSATKINIFVNGENTQNISLKGPKKINGENYKYLEENIFLKCPTNDGCMKKMKFEILKGDNENVANISEEIYISSVGNSCRADCSLGGLERYLKLIEFQLNAAQFNGLQQNLSVQLFSVVQAQRLASF